MKNPVSAALLALCLAVTGCAPWAAPGSGHDASAAALLPEVRAAAQQGDAAAQYDLGMMYANGWNVTRDDAQAAAWLRKAAEQGFAPAQNSLGLMYARGQGVPRDDAQAALWYRKAAEQGLAEARKNLAAMSAQGQNANQDCAQARDLWRKAGMQPRHMADCP